MLYKILADTVVIIHFLWILFLIFGVFLGVKYRGVKVLHIAGIIFALIIQVFDWYCPLTHIEIWLRQKHNPELSYTGSFIVHYVEKLIYIEIPRSAILILTIFLCGFNAFMYMKKR